MSRKICYYIWFSIQETIGEYDRIEKLTNNTDQTAIVASQHRMGKVFTIEEFAIFFYHLALFAFDHFPKMDSRIKDLN